MLPAFDFHQHGGITGDALRSFLVHCSHNNVSDIFLQGGGPLVVDLYGRKVQASEFRIEPPQLARLMDDVFSEQIKGDLKSGKGVDRALQLTGDIYNRYGLGRGERLRFRCNFVQATIGDYDMVPALTLRTIPTVIPQLESLGLEDDLFPALLPHKGIGLVVGETGSGKSTLLAAIYQYCAQHYPDRKIVTAEDPIEFLLNFPHAILMPEQSQIGRDVASFAEHLRLSLRRAPGVIGVGEIRDLETLYGAVMNGQSGHLCLSTMHTDSPGETIPRALMLVPTELREAMAHNLLSNLQYIIAQRLLRTTDGKRQAVREYLVFDDDVREELGRLDHTRWRDWIDNHLSERKARMSDKAWALYQQGRISQHEVLTVITRRELERRMSM
ncbi:plasmid transfer ATPase TraJ [Yersinia ruckeri]|uniref:plasmid transfer ATPase TraJ n=1 Tax=Yersinia ruckeri TaxID=29486 RepID=UPI000F8DCB14|nr:plasmid transfer ATPase TraJ [Yersinia ruckeri]MCK8540568.1 plasmid transfer ATPase TraJ [Yersinia ruckeri]MCK8572625.1 plasmid transfer ATPase TraJ [Yersinia ruckeri]MCK8576068.1 plasmid transfer ATPase TraJ [Yersinia ruckeri]MCK8578937.1 plasmid transfer ATPase TraJ [Yersinia ruckeri]MCK8582614.1 plasmid transfer ATPase TraJ [Yersinia ruckeri]